MGLALQVKKDGTAIPVFICDRCGQPIEEPFQANCEWNDSDGNQLITDMKFFHNEKANQCSMLNDEKGEPTENSVSMDIFICQLLDAMGLTPGLDNRLEEAYKNARSFGIQFQTSVDTFERLYGETED